MDIPPKCNCGALRGIVHDVSSRHGHRTVFMCDHRQAYLHYMGEENTVLDVNGGELAPKLFQALNSLRRK